MKHIHLEECSSTQILLKKKIEQNASIRMPLLISASRQTEGRGRRQNQWVQTDNALAFSLTFKPHPEYGLTPLEVASILIKYFQGQGYGLHLKWPNDLLNSKGQKCGGILCTFLTEEIVIVGVGLNYGKSNFEGVPDTLITPGSVDDQRVLDQYDKEKMPLVISRYLLENRMSSKQIVATWTRHCFHRDKKVVVVDGDQKSSGFFRGITSKGEAIIESDEGPEYVTAGSLIVEDGVTH